MKKTYAYIFSSIFLLVSTVHGQTQTDTTRYGGIRLSINLGKAAGYLTQPKEPGFEFMLDAEVKDGWFVVAEGGHSSLDLEKYNYTLSSGGTFGRLGIDRNFLNRAYNENEIIYGGLRIAGSRFTQQATNILIQNEYWGDVVTSVRPEQITAFWLEVTAGIRAELFPNFFIGWGIHGRMFLNFGEYRIKPYYVPGYGTTLKKSSLGFQYVIAYRIPYKFKH